MIKKDMAKIDFSRTAIQIKNKVYGLNPFMGAYGFYKEKKVKLWKVEILDDTYASAVLEHRFSEKIKPRSGNSCK